MVRTNPVRTCLPCPLRARVQVRPHWWTRPESNRLPLPCKGSALPDELQALVLVLSYVPREGVEPSPPSPATGI